MIRPQRLIPPASPVVDYEGVSGALKAFSREDEDGDRLTIEALERAAVDMLDGYDGRLGRCILRQQWALELAPSRASLRLPFPDAREVVHEARIEGVWTAQPEGVVDQIGDAVFLEGLADHGLRTRVTFWAGWESAAEVPESLKQAIRMLVEHWNTARNGAGDMDLVDDLPPMVAALISPWICLHG